MTRSSLQTILSLAPLFVAFALGMGMAMLGSRPSEAAQNQNQNLRAVEGFEVALNAVAAPEMPGWGRSNCASSEGEFSAWASALDVNSQPIDCKGPYPQEVTSGLILLVDLKEFSADIPVLDLRYDYRLETIEGDGNDVSGLLFFNVIQPDDEIGDILRTTVHASHADTQGEFREVRIDLNSLQDVYQPEREPFSLAGQDAIIEWMYFARSVSGGTPAGAFVDNVRLEYGDSRAPTAGPTIPTTATATPTSEPTEPTPSSSATPTTELMPQKSHIYLPYLHQPVRLAVP